MTVPLLLNNIIKKSDVNLRRIGFSLCLSNVLGCLCQFINCSRHWAPLQKHSDVKLDLPCDNTIIHLNYLEPYYHDVSYLGNCCEKLSY